MIVVKEYMCGEMLNQRVLKPDLHFYISTCFKIILKSNACKGQSWKSCKLKSIDCGRVVASGGWLPHPKQVQIKKTIFFQRQTTIYKAALTVRKQTSMSRSAVVDAVEAASTQMLDVCLKLVEIYKERENARRLLCMAYASNNAVLR